MSFKPSPYRPETPSPLALDSQLEIARLRSQVELLERKNKQHEDTIRTLEKTIMQQEEKINSYSRKWDSLKREARKLRQSRASVSNISLSPSPLPLPASPPAK